MNRQSKTAFWLHIGKAHTRWRLVWEDDVLHDTTAFGYRLLFLDGQEGMGRVRATVLRIRMSMDAWMDGMCIRIDVRAVMQVIEERGAAVCPYKSHLKLRYGIVDVVRFDFMARCSAIYINIKHHARILELLSTHLRFLSLLDTHRTYAV